MSGYTITDADTHVSETQTCGMRWVPLAGGALIRSVIGLHAESSDAGAVGVY